MLVAEVNRSFRALGTDCYVAGPQGFDDVLAEQIIESYELLWSRFIKESDISRLNAHRGSWVEVSNETVAIVELAITAWGITKGAFDPTILPALVHLGYGTSYETMNKRRPSYTLEPFVSSCHGIQLDHQNSQVRIPGDSMIDLGGIAKGYIADVVANRYIEIGAPWICVNLGGDVRIAHQESIEAPTWPIDVPVSMANVQLRLNNGSVATSSTKTRAWTMGELAMHHVVDPFTGQPAATDVVQATVIATDAMWAEVLAKSAIVLGSGEGSDLIHRYGCTGVFVLADDSVLRLPGIEEFQR